ncbi:MAG: hypothetical protein LKF48_00910 [Prevotella sp.]|jgi:hypothetical protein|nr:hypothetical protein [Prevotella sp.]MCH4181712.1 hypothetical protein [Prevotella sp.]MCH4240758.1 hypothetical protein [Prevotella sp.]
MKEDQECDFYVINLLENTDFLIYVLEDDVRQNHFWKRVIANNSRIRSSFHKAVDILRRLDHPPMDFYREEIDGLGNRIETSLKKE